MVTNEDLSVAYGREHSLIFIGYCCNDCSFNWLGVPGDLRFSWCALDLLGAQVTRR